PSSDLELVQLRKHAEEKTLRLLLKKIQLLLVNLQPARVMQSHEAGGGTRESGTGEFRLQPAQVLVEENIRVPGQHRSALVKFLDHDPAQEELKKMVRVTPPQVRVTDRHLLEQRGDIAKEEIPLPHQFDVRRRDVFIPMQAEDIHRLIVEPMKLRVL